MTGDELTEQGMNERGLAAEMLARALVKSFLEYPDPTQVSPKSERLVLGAVRPILELQWAPDVDPERDPRVLVATEVAATLGVMAQFVANSVRNLAANGADITNILEQLWSPYDLEDPEPEP